MKSLADYCEIVWDSWNPDYTFTYFCVPPGLFQGTFSNSTYASLPNLHIPYLSKVSETFQ